MPKLTGKILSLNAEIPLDEIRMKIRIRASLVTRLFCLVPWRSSPLKPLQNRDHCPQSRRHQLAVVHPATNPTGPPRIAPPTRRSSQSAPKRPETGHCRRPAYLAGSSWRISATASVTWLAEVMESLLHPEGIFHGPVGGRIPPSLDHGWNQGKESGGRALRLWGRGGLFVLLDRGDQRPTVHAGCAAKRGALKPLTR